MTGKEIIQALGNKKYGGHSCVNCKFGITKGEDRCGLKGCNITRNALALINRQQAEIERLKEDNFIKSQKRANIFEITNAFERGRTDGIKEFADRLCEGRVSNDPVVIAVKCELKEMVGEQE